MWMGLSGGMLRIMGYHSEAVFRSWGLGLFWPSLWRCNVVWLNLVWFAYYCFFTFNGFAKFTKFKKRSRYFMD